MLTLAADTRKAHIQAVAAEESVRYMRQVQQAAPASSELARRMEQVGNFTRLQRAREQSFHADAMLGLARAEQTQRVTRERLTRLLGVWGISVGPVTAVLFYALLELLNKKIDEARQTEKREAGGRIIAPADP